MKKICSTVLTLIPAVTLALIFLVLARISAFAIGDIPPKINTDLEVIEIDKNEFLSFFSSENDKKLAVDIINKTNVSNNDIISVTSVRSKNEISIGLCIADNGGSLSVKSQKINNSKKYQEINVYLNQNYKMLSFVYNTNGSVSGVNITNFPMANYIYGQYINSNLSCSISKISSNYNYIDGTIKQIKFISKQTGGGTPSVPSNPDSKLDIPQNPSSSLNIPDGNEYVPYDTKSTLSGFFGTISDNIGVSTNIGLIILGIVIGIPLILRIIKKFSKV